MLLFSLETDYLRNTMDVNAKHVGITRNEIPDYLIKKALLNISHL